MPLDAGGVEALTGGSSAACQQQVFPSDHNPRLSSEINPHHAVSAEDFCLSASPPRPTHGPDTAQTRATHGPNAAPNQPPNSPNTGHTRPQPQRNAPHPKAITASIRSTSTIPELVAKVKKMRRYASVDRPDSQVPQCGLSAIQLSAVFSHAAKELVSSYPSKQPSEPSTQHPREPSSYPAKHRPTQRDVGSGWPAGGGRAQPTSEPGQGGGQVERLQLNDFLLQLLDESNSVVASFDQLTYQVLSATFLSKSSSWDTSNREGSGDEALTLQSLANTVYALAFLNPARLQELLYQQSLGTLLGRHMADMSCEQVCEIVYALSRAKCRPHPDTMETLIEELYIRVYDFEPRELFTLLSTFSVWEVPSEVERAFLGELKKPMGVSETGQESSSGDSARGLVSFLNACLNTESNIMTRMRMRMANMTMTNITNMTMTVTDMINMTI
eukprot:gene10474-8437_t